jgi:hypothetical protein
MNRSDIPPRSSKTPPGLERALLRLMPRLFLLGTVILGLPSLGARLFPWDATEAEVAALVLRIDILAVSAVFVHWTALLTVAIGALVVVIMKGPAYFADSYPIDDSNVPGRSDRSP